MDAFDVAVTDLGVDGIGEDSGALDIATDGAMGLDAADVQPDACARATELCNGLDDDCDGTVDNIAPSTCGTGACLRTITRCPPGAGSPICTPGPSSAEICNGIDDDCNGTADDNIPPILCGSGLCLTPQNACAGGRPAACAAVVGTEVCGNGIDDDCDGVIDDGCPCDIHVGYRSNVSDGSGTQSDPFGQIQDGISAGATLAADMGRPARVCVAAVTNSTCSTTYFEDITMENDVEVFGGYDQLTWTRAARCTTTIQASGHIGVIFDADVTNSAVLDGFTVSGGSGMNTSNAITVLAGGTITNNTVTAGATAVPLGVAIGISLGSSAVPPAPPLVVNNTVSAASAPDWGIGIRVSTHAAILRGNTIVGFNPASGPGGAPAPARSHGLVLESAVGTQVIDNLSIRGGSGATSAGIFIQGSDANVIIARNAVIDGGRGTAAMAGTTASAIGISYDPIAPFGSGGTGARIFNNARIVGRSGSPMLSGLAIDVAGSHRPIIDWNTLIAGKVAPSYGGDGTGIRCVGSGTDCTVRANPRIAGYDTQMAGGANGRGIVFLTGASGQIGENASVVGCDAPVNFCVGIGLDGAAAVFVDDNRIDPSRSTLGSIGIFVHSTAALVSNNLVLINDGNGIALDIASTTAEATVHSNTVVVLPPFAGTVRETRALFIGCEAGCPAGGSGVFRNNIAACLGTASNRAAFREGPNADPRLVENNDFDPNCGTLYYDHTSLAIIALATVNLLSGVRMNRADDPGFVGGGDFHLTTASLLIDQGTSAGAPAFDSDLDPRPQRTAYDIGYDERP